MERKCKQLNLLGPVGCRGVVDAVGIEPITSFLGAA